jgi:hypothetical protein
MQLRDREREKQNTRMHYRTKLNAFTIQIFYYNIILLLAY